MDEAEAHAMQYLTLTDAMGYKAGPHLLSPEEYAEALRKDAERYRKLRAQAHSETPLVVVVDPLNPALGYTPEGLDAVLDGLPAVGAA